MANAPTTMVAVTQKELKELVADMVQVETAELVANMVENETAMQNHTANMQTQLTLNFGTQTFFMILLMQAGFCSLEAGTVRKKNLKNILIKNLLDASTAAICWYLLGYGFAFGGDACFMGGSGFASDGVEGLVSSGPGGGLHFVVNWGYAITSATIVSGCMAERTNLPGYLAFTMFITSFLYPIICRSAWNNHGLFKSAANCAGDGVGAVIDFAGSGVVHMSGGIAGLCGTIVLGPRSGRFDQYGRTVEFPSNSHGALVLGGILLWCGWYGFNLSAITAATALGEDGPLTAARSEMISRVVVNTTLAPAFAALLVLSLSWYSMGYYDICLTVNGVLAGLVAVTAGCATMDSIAAICTGLLSGVLYFFASRTVRHMRIDDVVDGFAVHGVSGAVGLLMAGCVSQKEYVEQMHGNSNDYDGVLPQLGVQLIFMLWIVCLVGGMSMMFLLVFDYLSKRFLHIGLRVRQHVELQGLDIHYVAKAQEAEEQRSTGICRIINRDAHFSVEQYQANNPTQDRFHVVVEASNDPMLDDMCFFGIYDGHLGDHMSSFLDDNMHNAVFRSLDIFPDPVQGLIDAFITMDEMWKRSIKDRFNDGEVDLATCGSCALVTVIKKGVLYTANAGDSRAVLVSVNDRGGLDSVMLSKDHNVENEDEVAILKERHPTEVDNILAGRAGQRRVKGLLKVTRALGDMYLKDAEFNTLPLPPLVQVKSPYNPPYIYNEPEVTVQPLDQRSRFILIASDGLWENLNESELTAVMQACCRPSWIFPNPKPQTIS